MLFKKAAILGASMVLALGIVSSSSYAGFHEHFHYVHKVCHDGTCHKSVHNVNKNFHGGRVHSFHTHTYHTHTSHSHYHYHYHTHYHTHYHHGSKR